MTVLHRLSGIAPTALLVVAIGAPVYALPATLSLPRGQRPGVTKLAIPQAALSEPVPVKGLNRFGRHRRGCQ